MATACPTPTPYIVLDEAQLRARIRHVADEATLLRRLLRNLLQVKEHMAQPSIDREASHAAR
ncbi:MAG: hypothetical protein U0871_01445 [Gemmataceae bacterium]